MAKLVTKSGVRSIPKLSQVPDQIVEQQIKSKAIQQANQSEILTGSALLQKVKELNHLSKKEKAIACGYTSVTQNGRDRVNIIKFVNAIIDAINPDPEDKTTGKVGRSASYRVSVQRNGNLLIGSTYTQQMGLNPGDQLEIRLGRKHIQLRPMD
jgi:AbrB-like transcriptional regulator